MRRSRRRFLGGLVALPLSSLPGVHRAHAAAPGHPIRLNIPGPGSLPFTPLELVNPLGIDRALGAELLIRYFPSGVQAAEDMLAGNADFAGLGFVVLPRMQAKGVEIVTIAPLSGETSPFSVVVRAELRGRIRALGDLRGRSVGVPVGSIKSKTYLQSMAEVVLASGGVKPNEVRWVGTGQNIDGLVGALAGNVVDAVFCEEPFSSALVRRGTGFLLADLRNAKLAASVPGAGHLRAMIATRPALIRQDPERVALMVQMLRRALAWMQEQTPAAIVARLRVADDADQADRVAALRNAASLFPRNTRFSRAQVEATRTFLRASGDPAADTFDAARLVDDTWAGSRP
jgi:NitT/TauT family transport system substrate-binding protein